MNADLYKNFDRYQNDYLIQQKKMGSEVSAETHSVIDFILKERGIIAPEKYGSPDSNPDIADLNTTRVVASLFGWVLIIVVAFVVTAVAAALFKETIQEVIFGVSNDQFVWGLTTLVPIWTCYQIVRGVKNSGSTMSKTGKIVQVFAHFTFTVLGIALVYGTSFNVRTLSGPLSIEFVITLLWFYATVVGIRWLFEVFRKA